MKKFLSASFLIYIIIVAFACNSKRKATEEAAAFCDTMQIETRIMEDDPGEHPQFISDRFINDAADAYTIQNLREKHSDLLSLKKEPFKNMHDTSRVDTIYHFIGARDSIKFYRSKEKAFMIYLDVSSPELGINRCIRPGLSKERFRTIFQLPQATGNVVRISNVDGTLVFIFYFRDNQLKRIESDIYFG